MDKIWTNKDIEQIKYMLSEKQSWPKIAAHFGVSKNAIAGIIWRRIKNKCKNPPQEKEAKTKKKEKKTPNIIISFPKLKPEKRIRDMPAPSSPYQKPSNGRR